jgi:hypothetical protein
MYVPVSNSVIDLSTNRAPSLPHRKAVLSKFMDLV